MPIHRPTSLTSISQEEFAQLDFEVMGCAYASQNELGRLCDECVYQKDIKERLSSNGFEVQTEVPLCITHRDFSKTYFLDLVVANSVLYELKTSKTLTGEHDAQVINYALLLELERAKLINLRPPQGGGPPYRHQSHP